MDNDKQLLQQFVADFTAFDSLQDLHAPPEMRVDSPDGIGWCHWRPIVDRLPASALTELYENLPGPLPPLFEELLLSYRWLEVDLGGYRLLHSAPFRGLTDFMSAVTKDSGLCEYLLPRRFVQFARAEEGCYDPVCFDLNRRHADGDCAIVRFEHEDILCEEPVVRSWDIAPSFRTLVNDTVNAAKAMREQGGGGYA